MKKRCFLAFFVLVALNAFCQENRLFTLQEEADRNIPVNQTLNKNIQLELFESKSPISGLAISADISLYSDSSLVRVILADHYGDEYLIYETYPILAGTNRFSVAGVAEESASLDQVIPFRVKVELVDASIRLKEILVSEGGGSLKEMKRERLQQQSLDKIRRINEHIQQSGQHWVAGETSLSRLSYQEKLGMFGGNIPNFQGFEYYVGGVFVLPGETTGTPGPDGTKSVSAVQAESEFAREFSWRNRHGEDWVTEVKSQWNCKSDWAFGAAGATELMANIYFNQHLDYDLSEQNLIACVGEWGCDGGWISSALDYIINYAIYFENCYSYRGVLTECGKWNTCEGNQVHFMDWTTLQTDEDFKRAVISGATAADLIDWRQSMQITGYKVLEEGDNLFLRNEDMYWVNIGPGDPLIGKTAWQCKLSYGENWGDEGYMYLVAGVRELAMYTLYGPVSSFYHDYFDIRCVDNDQDGYYTWGIGRKPAHCPESPAEPDGDDSDPCIGPMNEYGIFSSSIRAPATNDTMILSGMNVPDLYAAGEQVRWYSDPELTQLVSDTNWFATGQTGPGDYTYFVTQTSSGCVSDARDVTLSIVNEIPSPRGHDTAIYVGRSSMLQVTGARGAEFLWYDDPSMSNVLHTGAWFNPHVTEFGTYVYYVTQTLYEQESAVDTVFLRVVHPVSPSLLLALIQEGVDTDGNSQISLEEAEVITYLNVEDYEIKDMTGIESLYNLDTLYCGENHFASLDVSSNLALKYLDCSGYPLITVTPLQTLNLTGCTGLTWLDCSSSSLTSLDLSSCTALTHLDCSFNPLTYLDLSANTELSYLNCKANEFSCLDLSNNTLIGSGDGDDPRLDLGFMPFLTEVCVWTTPFPPAGLEINISGSQNLYFTENCSGCFTGIEGIPGSGLSVYPNPTTGFITIHTVHPEHMTVEIASPGGQLIAIREMEGGTLQLDLSSFPKGVYFITFRSRNALNTRKIVKL